MIAAVFAAAALVPATLDAIGRAEVLFTPILARSTVALTTFLFGGLAITVTSHARIMRLW